MSFYYQSNKYKFLPFSHQFWIFSIEQENFPILPYTVFWLSEIYFCKLATISALAQSAF